MKVRRGFVSNSSSMSSIILAKNVELEDADPNSWDSYLYLELPQESNYNRGRIELLNTVKQKIEWLITMASMSIVAGAENPDDYYEKMAFLKERIRKLGKKHKYDISIITPPLYGSRKSHWDSELKKSIIDPGWCYDVNCSTESYLDWNFVASDDDRLERFLFSPKSFVIVGGDEYDETYKLEWEAKRSIDYEYERVGDYKNWGEHPPAYWDGENIPDYDEDLWGEQPNLPFSETPYYHI